jgi:integrase
MDAILAACDPRWRLIVALTTVGLRRAEILNLTVSDVDFEHHRIEVRHKNYTRSTWEWRVKDREDRFVPLTGLLEPLLLKAISDLPEGQPYLLIPPKRYKYLLHLRDTGRLNERTRNCPVNNFRRDFCEILEKAGVENKTFHALRGTACVTMLEKGLAPHEAQKVLGHSDVRTTMRHYASSPRQGFLHRASQTAFSGR